MLSQELYLIVFLARYLDLFTSFHSLYNTCMKLIFIGASAWSECVGQVVLLSDGGLLSEAMPSGTLC